MASSSGDEPSWESSAQDFGQKVDLTVRIREILRNYPEGLSILKELLQNADDAGARTVRLCTVEPRSYGDRARGPSSPLSALATNAPSLLAHNSASFTETDFASIQRVGDSLKKAGTVKTGRFGVGVNSTYHLTDLPMFRSGNRVVLFDPQARYLPGVDPANPGKMVRCDTAEGRRLVKSLPEVFDVLNVWGGDGASTENYDGTLFRFALRDEEGARASRLSHQAHSLESVRALLERLADVAPSVLLFLKHVEVLEIHHWRADAAAPELLRATRLANENVERTRPLRAYAVNPADPAPARPVAVDYALEFDRDGVAERWIVRQQLGGGRASAAAKDPRYRHLRLSPWAGVAARASPPTEEADGRAYCVLPLPASTGLPVHVNGYFELSSNRRDVWWGEDLERGDGKARADWNKWLVEDVAAPCYRRLVLGCARSESASPGDLERLLPARASRDDPWSALSVRFYESVRNDPVLWSEGVGEWVSPASALLTDGEERDDTLAEILTAERLPLVRLKSRQLWTRLLETGCCARKASPAFLRAHFRTKGPHSSLTATETRHARASHLLSLCVSDLPSNDLARELSDCPFVPLMSGALGTFARLRPTPPNTLTDMGYGPLRVAHALRVRDDNPAAAAEFLLDEDAYDASAVVRGVDPYLVCDGGDGASLLRRAADSSVDASRTTGACREVLWRCRDPSLNVVRLSPALLPDVVDRALPRGWRARESVAWDPDDDKGPSAEWFASLWRYACANDGAARSLARRCVVPTEQGLACALSAGESVIDAKGLPEEVKRACVAVGARTLLPGTLPTDLVVPREIWDHLHRPDRSGVIRAIDAASRRAALEQRPSPFDNAPDEARAALFAFLASEERGPIDPASHPALRSFPIFRRYADDETDNVSFSALDETRERRLLPASSTTLLDERLATSDFVRVSPKRPAERALLVALGARSVSRVTLYRDFVVPRLPDLSDDLCRDAVAALLAEVPVLGAADPSFLEFLTRVPLVPSAVTRTLSRVPDLYDPDVETLVALVDADSFPREELAASPALRELGLRDALTWEALLDCARSVEAKGLSDREEDRREAVARGRRLLAFLDDRWRDLFPELAPQSGSATRRLLRRVHRTIFEDPEKKERDARAHEARVNALLDTAWVPAMVSPPRPGLPWRDGLPPVCAPRDAADVSRAWWVSCSKRILDGEVRSIKLRRRFGWTDPVRPRDAAAQLRWLGEHYDRLREERAAAATHSADAVEVVVDDADSLRRTLSTELPRVYDLLDRANDDELEDVRAMLADADWLWTGDAFVSSDRAAFISSVHAAPWLVAVPPDAACFRRLLTSLGVRRTFSSSDFAAALRRMADEGDPTPAKERVDAAVALAQALSDDAARDGDAHAPDERGVVRPAADLVYDDAPWSPASSSDAILVHPKISHDVARRLGARSRRRLLLEEHGAVDVVDFGEDVVHEAFGQSESLTRRLRNIVEMYPEGPQQLGELVQNADDAGATIVRLVVSRRRHGTRSLLGPRLDAWQGPALLVHNDSVFSAADFRNLARIGQASKLERLATTGRFGLGFNSVFHWTDVPSFVSGDHLVFFDPHERYVPGATATSRGLRVRFAGTSLRERFPDQTAPYRYFGCDVRRRFEGTLFRFPFRNETTAQESEISRNRCGEGDAMERLVNEFRKVISRFLLFLKSVRTIEVYEEENNDAGPQLLYRADVRERRVVGGGRRPRPPPQTPQQPPSSGLDQLRSLANTTVGGFFSATNPTPIRGHPHDASSDWNAISDFIVGSPDRPLSKEAFYNKLLRTPDNELPKTRHMVRIVFEEFEQKAKTLEADISSSSSSVEATVVDGENESKVIEQEEGVEITAQTNPFHAPSVTVTDDYLVCMTLGAGECRLLACRPEHRDLKFVPWAGVAAHLFRDNAPPSAPTKGGAFCGLPLPAETGLPAHVHGAFELAANRRDVWFGDDMTGRGAVRSAWNAALCRDAVSPAYAELMIAAREIAGPGDLCRRLWPCVARGEVWREVVEGFHAAARDAPLLRTEARGGRWIQPRAAMIVSANEDDDDASSRLVRVLLAEELDVVHLPARIARALKEHECGSVEVTPRTVRSWYRSPSNHPSLRDRSDALFLLEYCASDIASDKRRLHELTGLPLVPLCDGTLGTVRGEDDDNKYFVVTETERDLLSHASRRFVDVWTEKEAVNDLLRDAELHAQTSLSNLTHKDFVKLLGLAYPPEWADLPEVRWKPEEYEAEDSAPRSKGWIKALWRYLGERRDGEPPDVRVFADTWHIVPAIVSRDNDRSLLKLSVDAPLVCPARGGSYDLPDDVVALLADVGVRVVDVTALEDAPLRLLDPFSRRPTASGILRAFRLSLPPAADDDELRRRVAARFRGASDERRGALRDFLLHEASADARRRGGVAFDEDDARAMRLLPVLALHGGDGGRLADLVSPRFAPPACADRATLDDRFVRDVDPAHELALRALGVTEMSAATYYEVYVCPRQSTADPASRLASARRLLRDLPAARADADDEWLARVADSPCVPNRRGDLVRPRDLYDPERGDLAGLLDDAVAPHEELSDPTCLASLRSLSLRQRLSREGVLDRARVAERDDDRERATALLRYLDNDETMERLVRECREPNGMEESDDNDDDDEGSFAPSFDVDTEEGRFLSELRDVAWLPVETEDDRDRSNAVAPPRSSNASSSRLTSSPRRTRPKADEWICSATMNTLRGNVRSNNLLTCLRWNEPVSVVVVASQLLSLSQTWEDAAEEDALLLRRHFATVVPRCYELLNDRLEVSSPDERERAFLLLNQQQPWVWVGERFVSTSRVAFDAPENARPYLFTVPQELLCFDALFRACGVRETFHADDFVRLTFDLSAQLDGREANSKQLDLAVGMAKLLSRLPVEELAAVDTNNVFLPSKDRLMFRANQMLYDDAPWLSALATRTKTGRKFVHDDVGNDAARVLGARSLREVLSASQNGMVKIPCPTKESLAELFERRDVGETEDRRVLSELFEIAETNGAKQVSVMFDQRAHETESLLTPAMSHAQGPSIVVCFHDVILKVDDLVQHSSPAKYYEESVRGRGGCGGPGFPRFGRGVASCFYLTDMVQILCGNQLIFFDPTGEFFFDGNVELKRERNENGDKAQTTENGNHDGGKRRRSRKRPTARSYGISSNFISQFPDQFEPFVSLPYGVRESFSLLSGRTGPSTSPVFRGTIFRLPLRTEEGPESNICERCFDSKAMMSLLNTFKKEVPTSFLFTYNLQGINVDEWEESNSNYSPILYSRVSSSPIVRRNHHDDIVKNEEWKKSGSKITKLFKAAWEPVESSYTLQVSNRDGSGATEKVDTYLIKSILAPRRLRDMASTEVLKTLGLTPSVSLAARIHQSKPENSENKVTFELEDGSMYVGLNTNIKTGLPFFINAPVFLHELNGDVLLEKDDDKDLKEKMPSIRNVIVRNKQKDLLETRAVALHVWNREAITSAMNLIPRFICRVKEAVSRNYYHDPRHLYCFWPHYKRIESKYKQLIPDTVYEDLGRSDIYLTERGNFRRIHDGIFTSPEYTISPRASQVFQEDSLMFAVPQIVVQDLEHFNVPIKNLTPSLARKLLKKQANHVARLRMKPNDALDLLTFCLTDLTSSDNFDYICRTELQGLCLMPMADGSVGIIGQPMIVATEDQQRMLPSRKNLFVSSSAQHMLKPFLEKSGFLDALGISTFGPSVLARHIDSVLPREWQGKDFVPWDCTNNAHITPSRLWLYQFWKEVNLWDRDIIQLFSRWPLIPTLSGELANCGNFKFIISFCPSECNEILRNDLLAEYSTMSKEIDNKMKRDLALKAAENRAKNEDEKVGNLNYCDQAYLDIGLEPNNSVDTVAQEDATDMPNNSSDEVQSHPNLNSLPSGPTNDNTSDGQQEPVAATPSINLNSNDVGSTERQVQGDPVFDSLSLKTLHGIVRKLRCPMLEMSFFDVDHLPKLLPPDRLSISRSILVTLNQCINYWTHITTTREPRLLWSSLEPCDLDLLVMLIAADEGSRLSLMQSDLTLLRNLPLFETMSHEWVSLKARDQHFTLDPSIDIESLHLYLPDSLKSKFLVEKSDLGDILKDLGVQPLTEARILQDYVLPQFPAMPVLQKESVCETLLQKWIILRQSNEFVDVLKETPFVKRARNDTGGEIEFVQARELMDPRNEFLHFMFDGSYNKFPYGEFNSEDWLTILTEVGLNNEVDKDTFLMIASRIETENNIEKAIKLHEYYADHFGEFYDSTHDFTRKLSEIKCVPAEFDGGSLSLHKYNEIAIPKDRHLIFKVFPVIPSSVAPPQVMFSSLGIQSPPTIKLVLKQIRILTENGGTLDQWNYKYGTIDEVFGNIFSFLQDNYDKLSPMVQSGLREKAIVPVGTTLVKASRLFIRLAKDLAPFFFEVPRAFGAYDTLLRQLGVRDSPQIEDYAVSLTELKQEIGDGMLNANELNSSVEVLTLISNEQAREGGRNLLRNTIFAPDSCGVLTSVVNLVQNDRPWLIQANRLNHSLVHIVHPKVTKELCQILEIGMLSERVSEHLQHDSEYNVLTQKDATLSKIERTLQSDEFIGMIGVFIGTKSQKLRNFKVHAVDRLQTRFILSSASQEAGLDITRDSSGTYCFIESHKNVLITQNALPAGLTCELVISVALCDYFKIKRDHVAAISAMLASSSSHFDVIGKTFGVGTSTDELELRRGEPGANVVGADMELVELKPLKVFGKGEIVAIRTNSEDSSLIYGVVLEGGGGNSLSRLKVRSEHNKVLDLLTTDIFSFRRGSKAKEQRDIDTRTVDLNTLNFSPGGLVKMSTDDFELSEPVRGDQDKDGSSNIQSFSPVGRTEVLTAVQDLLQSTNLSLNDDVDNVLSLNLKLQDENARKDENLNLLMNEGKELAKEMTMRMDSFLCPITRDLMEDPVICADGHTYERSAINEWLRSSSRSPKTNQRLPSRDLIPNHAMRSTIEGMKKGIDAVKKFTDAFN